MNKILGGSCNFNKRIGYYLQYIFSYQHFMKVKFPALTLFLSPQWSCSPALYVTWRLLVAVYFSTWIILSGAWSNWWYSTQANAIKWFIYLTNWTFLSLVLNLIFRAALVLWFHSQFTRKSREYLGEHSVVLGLTRCTKR